MDLLTFLLFSLIVILGFLHALELFRRRKLPPGPIGLPIIGSLLDIGPKPHESFAKLAKTYGPLMAIRLGSITSVVVSSPDMAREILQKNDEAFSGRAIPDAVSRLEHLDHALLWMSAEKQWRTLRRLIHTKMTNPTTVESMGGLRRNVVEEMVQHIRELSTRGEVVDIGNVAFSMTLNHISNICFSTNVADFSCRDVEGFQNRLKTILEIAIKFNISDYFPWLKAFDLQGVRRKAKTAYGWLEDYCSKCIHQRLKERESNLPRRGDFMDSMLDCNQENSSLFSLKKVEVLLVEMILAGTDTTATSVTWAMTELVRSPKVMAKLRQEISQVIGQHGEMEESKILALPYLRAVVKETLRLHTPIPFLVPHRAECEVKLNEYIIPKDTQIFINVWGISRDSEYWPDDPECFLPKRFMESRVDFRGQDFNYLPFSSGRRMCPGVTISQRLVSLAVASLVHQFDWELPSGMTGEMLDMDDKFGLTLQRATPLLLVPTIRE